MNVEKLPAWFRKGLRLTNPHTPDLRDVRCPEELVRLGVAIERQLRRCKSPKARADRLAAAFWALRLRESAWTHFTHAAFKPILEGIRRADAYPRPPDEEAKK